MQPRQPSRAIVALALLCASLAAAAAQQQAQPKAAQQQAQPKAPDSLKVAVVGDSGTGTASQ